MKPRDAALVRDVDEEAEGDEDEDQPDEEEQEEEEQHDERDEDRKPTSKESTVPFAAQRRPPASVILVTTGVSA